MNLSNARENYVFCIGFALYCISSRNSNHIWKCSDNQKGMFGKREKPGNGHYRYYSTFPVKIDCLIVLHGQFERSLKVSLACFVFSHYQLFREFIHVNQSHSGNVSFGSLIIKPYKMAQKFPLCAKQVPVKTSRRCGR